MQPNINLAEPGFNLQVGTRPKTWVTLGFDYSVGMGRNTLVPGMLLPAVQTQIGGQLGQLAALGMVPPGYQLALPTNTRTQSLQIGPDFPIRHFQAVTFFVRPNLGALQLVATPRPGRPDCGGHCKSARPVRAENGLDVFLRIWRWPGIQCHATFRSSFPGRFRSRSSV